MNNSASIKVSVIIPVYNSQKYLQSCLESVIAQSLGNIEIIIIDDGSTDDSWATIQKFAVKDSRIVALRQGNKGVSAARNAGLRRATGEYIGFVDADDFVDPNYFQALYDTAVREQADIATAYIETEDEGRQRFYNHTNKRAVAQNKANLKGVVWLNLYKRSLIERYNISFLPKLRTAEDNLFNLQASHYANKIESIEENVAHYHHVMRDGSLMTQQYDEKNLVLLLHAVLETVKVMNSMAGYDKETYVFRLVDAFCFFDVRFTEPEKLSKLTRLKLATTAARIWQIVRYREELLEIVADKEIDLSRLMYGGVYERLYDKNITHFKDQEERKARSEMKRAEFIKKTKRRLSPGYLKGLSKKIAKSILPHGVVVLYKRRLEVMSKIKVSSGSGSLDDNKIAVVVPFQNVKYAELVKLAVEKAGYEAVDAPSDAKFIWLHWYEDGIKNYSDFMNKLSAIRTWKEQGRKVIVHIHNKKPHESPVPSITHALMTTLTDSADRVSIMSSETKNVLKNIWYYGDDFDLVSTVPHPNYIGAYGKKLKPSSALKDDTLRILFFGLVRPYKGIEYLLEATKEMKNVEISIYGKPKDDVYVRKIMDLCGTRSNVTFRLEHIPDEDIPSIFAEHHLVALPYSSESSLNSGAALLALSYARTVVGTNNGTLKDLESQDLYFGYDYKDEKDHVRQLQNTILSIQKKYDGNYNELLAVGERAYSSIKMHNSLGTVAQSIDDMIKRLG